MIIAAISLPVGIVLFSLTRSLLLSLIMLFCVGAANILVVNLANALVQGLVPDAVRGRVMGIYTLSFFGFMPIGAILAGSLATVVGVPLAIALGGVCFLLCALAVNLLVPTLWRQA